ncbi:thioredoxin-disulfide reductase [Thermosulfurimonas sp. F29]|uniref:thioredoxin-disulfide reductase n=1 Tax=Thermosulfurimonas sp. F29 TaxID=2867247 RepID=UPI001C835604|nr:thioredoxin-disulfide reductase [Thermosulfurimonas sp. F29]MBX6422207.1 thioredoxin-disulfide reductase [Thermosulfurimonas sp. F29]
MEREFDLIIVGGGPAGLTAYIYAARARLRTVLVEKLSPGGQVLVTDWVENYPGFPEGISGAELMEKFAAQARALGLEPVLDEAVGLTPDGDLRLVHLAGGKTLAAPTVIIATGASPKKLGVPGEAELTGKGVSYCATCDGPFFRDEVIAVVGGGNTAVQESLFLTRFARKIYLIHRRDQLRATRILQERALSHPQIEPLWNTVVTEVLGEDRVEGLRIKNVKTGEESTLAVGGVFIFIGIKPQTEWLGGTVALDEAGFVVTDSETRTSLPGVFAAGDVRAKACRQIVTAAGDGAVAAYMAEHYLAERRGA